MGQLIFLIIFAIAIAFSLKKQLDRAAREEGEGEREGEEAEELWREAARRGIGGPQEPIPVEPVEDAVEIIALRPELLRLRREAAQPVERVRPAPGRREAVQPRRVEPAAVAGVQRPPPIRTLKATAAVKGIYTRRTEVRLPKFKSPIVTAIVYHEILMPPVGIRTEEADPFARIV